MGGRWLTDRSIDRFSICPRPSFSPEASGLNTLWLLNSVFASVLRRGIIPQCPQRPTDRMAMPRMWSVCGQHSLLAQWVGLCACRSSVVECYSLRPQAPCTCRYLVPSSWGVREARAPSLKVSYQNCPKFPGLHTQAENAIQGPELQLFLVHFNGVACFSKCPSQHLEFEISSF